MRPVPRARLRQPVRSSLVPALLLAAALVAAPESLLAARPEPPLCTPQVFCSDPRGCPDFAVDPGVLTNVFYDVHTFAADDCAVGEGMVAAGTRKLILFVTQINNIGAGDLVLGNPLDHPEWFDLETCHGHPHIKDYADYRLWTVAGYDTWTALRAANPGLCAQQVLDANPDLATQLVKGAKRGFCFFDVVLMGEIASATQACPSAPDPQKYFDCDNGGLSVCWADVYEPIYGVIDGQWIDVTDVPDGDYFLENEANAKRLMTEADYTNNAAAVKIRIMRGRVRVLRR